MNKCSAVAEMGDR